VIQPRRAHLLVAVCVRPSCGHRSDQHGIALAACLACEATQGDLGCHQYHPLHNTYGLTTVAGYQYLRCRGCHWEAASKFRGVEIVCHL
jgi:hypothetical protein